MPTTVLEAFRVQVCFDGKTGHTTSAADVSSQTSAQASPGLDDSLWNQKWRLLLQPQKPATVAAAAGNCGYRSIPL